MDFALTDEQRLIIKTTREFVEHELYPTKHRSRRRASCLPSS